MNGRRSGASGQLYNFQNVSLKNDPNPALKRPGCGFPAPTPIAYDTNVLVGQTGHNFYLDPVSISDSNPEYLLRAIVLGDISRADFNHALRARYPEWFGPEACAASNGHQRFSRAREDIRDLLRCVISRAEPPGSR